MVDLKTNLFFFFLSETSSEKYCLEMEQNYFQFFKNKFIRTLKKAKSNFFLLLFFAFYNSFFSFLLLWSSWKETEIFPDKHQSYHMIHEVNC